MRGANSDSPCEPSLANSGAIRSDGRKNPSAYPWGTLGRRVPPRRGGKRPYYALASLTGKRPEVGFVRGQILAHPSRVRFWGISDLRTKASLTGKRPRGTREGGRRANLRISPASRVDPPHRGEGGKIRPNPWGKRSKLSAPPRRGEGDNSERFPDGLAPWGTPTSPLRGGGKRPRPPVGGREGGQEKRSVVIRPPPYGGRVGIAYS